MKSTTYRAKYTKKSIIKINDAQINDKSAYNLKNCTTQNLKLSHSFKKKKEKSDFRIPI